MDRTSADGESGGTIYEYACHEGNYGMFGILSGARAIEKKVANGGSPR